MPSYSQQLRSLKSKYMSGEIRSRHEAEEFGPGKQEFIFCPHGEAVYYAKAWHPIGEFFLRAPHLSGDKRIIFRLCPAHILMKNKQYEGEVNILNVRADKREMLLRLIKNTGERAMKRDPMDRVIAIRSTGKDVLVTTTENQLAQRIGRKIRESFKNRVCMEIKRAEGTDFVRVNVEFAS